MRARAILALLVVPWKILAKILPVGIEVEAWPKDYLKHALRVLLQLMLRPKFKPCLHVSILAVIVRVDKGAVIFAPLLFLRSALGAWARPGAVTL